MFVALITRAALKKSPDINQRNNMNTSLVSLISFLVTFQLLFIGLFLVTHKKGKKVNNIILGLIFLMIGWNMADMTLRISSLQTELGFFQLIDDGFFLLYGPLFYVYVKLVIYNDFTLNKRIWPHLVPYIFVTLFLIFSFGTKSVQPVSQSDNNSLPWYIHVISYSLYLPILIYLGLAYKELLGYREIIRKRFSRIDDINLNWLSFTLKTMGSITILSLVHNFFVISGNNYLYSTSLLLFLAFLFYFVNHVIFKALKQPEIFAGIDLKEVEKYLGSNLTNEQIGELKSQLLDLFSEEKVYMNPQINIGELAEKLETSSKSLSQVINLSFNKNFFDFINSFRIEEAKNIMLNTNDVHLTVLEVMYQSGFNSKSSFNTAFKKATGQTPTQFKKGI